MEESLSFETNLSILTSMVAKRLKGKKKELLEEEVAKVLKELSLWRYVEKCSYMSYDTAPIHMPETSGLQKKLFEFNLSLKRGNEDFKYDKNNYKIVIVCGEIYEFLDHDLFE